MKKFKNLEDLWQYIKKGAPSGVSVTTIEKSSQQKLFYVTVPKALVICNKKADYELTFMETGSEIEVFIEPTNDSFSIFDVDDLKEVMPVALKESLNEASVYAESTSVPGWDNVIQFEYHNGRAQLQRELENAFGKGRAKFQLVALPNNEFELYVKKDKTSQWIEFLRGGLSESVTFINRNKMNESENQDRYREFFENKLKQYNVSSPSELSQDEKSKFFQEVKTEWAEEKKKQGINEAFNAHEMSKDMMNDFEPAERKFIEENIPGIKKWFQVYRGKALMAAAALAKKSKRIANEPGIAGMDYTAYESPKGMRFVCASGWEFGVFYIFPEQKINENYLTEAEVMKATGKLYFTEETAGQMSGEELQNALKNLSDTMSQLSADPTEDSVKAYKECEDSYQCLKDELAKRGLNTVN